ncbi:DUF397 domain-containing protein [Streptomyces sp. NPDC059787]|uniref:DUF397 domain-containing protein n=1 Tax=Streptomyces sp. NPDC059787 TaxID=3346947 RepID=UPI0036690E5C
MNRVPGLADAVWRESSCSDGGASNCVEVADGHVGLVPVRDSKVPHGPVIVFGSASWASFVTELGSRRRQSWPGVST